MNEEEKAKANAKPGPGRPKAKKGPGRPKGVPNKSRQALITRLSEKFPEWDPVVDMADIANDPNSTTEQRLNADKEVAKYLYSPMKAIEVGGDSVMDIARAIKLLEQFGVDITKIR